MAIRDWVLGLVNRRPRSEEGGGRKRGPATHVVILDGTMSSLADGFETNAGLTFKLLREAGHKANLTVYYEAGIQWRDWTETFGVIAGRGINRQIERAYGVLCSRWHPEDRIVLIGYSRGAFAVRSLAGVIQRIGIVKHHDATERHVKLAYRYYTHGARSPFARRFKELYCDRSADVAAIGVWDTVKSLGLRLPILWKFEEKRHSFHSDGLEPCVRSAFHALALDETRDAFSPEMWSPQNRWNGQIEQVWFKGTHGDIGGQLGGRLEVRPLSNIPLVWLLDRLESQGLPLPDGWRDRFPSDVTAPSVGTWAQWGKLFWSRHRRKVGRDPSERLHETVADRGLGTKKPAPKQSGLEA